MMDKNNIFKMDIGKKELEMKQKPTCAAGKGLDKKSVNDDNTKEIADMKKRSEDDSKKRDECMKKESMEKDVTVGGKTVKTLKVMLNLID
jgi:hypothetical protein